MKHFRYNKKHFIALWHAFCKWQTQKHMNMNSKFKIKTYNYGTKR